MLDNVLPIAKGTYLLLLELNSPARLTIGKLGAFDFAAGWYIYSGSAFGAGGLRGRLKHHLAPLMKPHWHIDYLRQAAPCRELGYFADTTCYEHEWAQHCLNLSGASVPVVGFGASDCRCITHLVYFAAPPFLELIVPDITKHLVLGAS